MPRKKDAKVIARMACPTPECNHTVAVFQNRRGYLYTRCPACGADQRNGPDAQRYFWAHATPVPGVDPADIERPRNVPEWSGPIGSGPVQEPGVKPEQVPAKPEPARVPAVPEDPQASPAAPAKPATAEPMASKPARGGLALLFLALVGLTTAVMATAKGG